MRNFALENLFENNPQNPIFIGVWKYSRWGSEHVRIDLSVDRLVNRQTIKFLTVGVTIDLPVDRPR